MKLLLDENLPKRLKKDLINHTAFTVFEKGWSGISNGKLLQLMIDDEIQVLLTFDKNLQYQQNFRKYTISVLVLNAIDNRYETLARLVPKILEQLSQPLIEGPFLISE